MTCERKHSALHQESTASDLLHIGNEHAIVQCWINGLLLADGSPAFGQVPEPDEIADCELDTGSLPRRGCENCRERFFVAKEASRDDNSGYLP